MEYVSRRVRPRRRHGGLRLTVSPEQIAPHAKNKHDNFLFRNARVTNVYYIMNKRLLWNLFPKLCCLKKSAMRVVVGYNLAERLVSPSKQHSQFRNSGGAEEHSISLPYSDESRQIVVVVVDAAVCSMWASPAGTGTDGATSARSSRVQ